MGPTNGSKLQSPKRYITTNNSHGQSIFSTKFSETPPSTSYDALELYFNYGTDQTPPDFRTDQDLSAYQHLIDNPPGIIIPHGSSARVVDIPPGYTSLMHRTISLNYNFVICGKVQLILDSGETRDLFPGDMAVQRAVNHAWKNCSMTEWARITAFAIPAIPSTEMNANNDI